MEFQISLKTISRRNQEMVTKNKKLINDIVRLDVLREEVEYYKTLLREHDTGHIHTAIGFIKRRIEELEGKAPWPLD
jgi:hypothetical protein